MHICIDLLHLHEDNVFILLVKVLLHLICILSINHIINFQIFKLFFICSIARNKLFIPPCSTSSLETNKTCRFRPNFNNNYYITYISRHILFLFPILCFDLQTDVTGIRLFLLYFIFIQYLFLLKLYVLKNMP